MTKVAPRTVMAEAVGLLSRNWGSEDYQADICPPLRLRGTFNPSPPRPCPGVPAVDSSLRAALPTEVCSLLNLTFTRQGGILPRGSKEQGTTILKTLSTGHFQSVLELTQQTKRPEKSPTWGPAPFGQKWRAAPKLWTSWNSICYNVTSRVQTWLVLSSRIEVFV